MIALCLYLCMSLFSYNAADPGWTRSSGELAVQNAGGRMGAWIADVLLLVLGYLAYLFPLIVAIKVWQMFRRRHLPFIWNGWLFSWRLIGFVLTLLAGTDRKSTRLNSSHVRISYAVFCLKKKNKKL